MTRADHSESPKKLFWNDKFLLTALQLYFILNTIISLPVSSRLVGYKVSNANPGFFISNGQPATANGNIVLMNHVLKTSSSKNKKENWDELFNGNKTLLFKHLVECWNLRF